MNSAKKLAVEAALAAGCSPILVLTGRGQEQALLLGRRGYEDVPVVRDLTEAVEFILDVTGSL